MIKILFKGKRKDNGEWIEGFYVCLGNDLHYILTGKLDLTKHCVMFEKHAVIPETVGQYTGLTDKNGKKIFEGDVVNFKTTAYFFKNCRINYESQFARFCAIDNKGYEYPMDKTFNNEIIGNVFDNPELLRSDTE